MTRTKTRIARSLGISKKNTIFLRSDFESFGTATRVTRALQELIAEGRIIRVGRGIYARARPSGIPGKPVPLEPLETIAHKALAALGVDARLGSAEKAYVGRLTQDVPMEISIDVGSSRISRRIELGGRGVNLRGIRNARSGSELRSFYSINGLGRSRPVIGVTSHTSLAKTWRPECEKGRVVPGSHGNRGSLAQLPSSSRMIALET